MMCQIKHCSHLSKLDGNSEASCGDPSPPCTPVSSEQAYPAPDTQRQIKPETRSQRHTYTHTSFAPNSQGLRASGAFHTKAPLASQPCSQHCSGHTLSPANSTSRMERTAWVAPLRPASTVLAQPSQKKEPGASNRGLHGLTDGGILHTEARPWRDTSPGVFTSGKGGRVPVTEGTDVRSVCRLPGKPAEPHALHCPFNKSPRWSSSDGKITTRASWGREPVCRLTPVVRLCG